MPSTGVKGDTGWRSGESTPPDRYQRTVLLHTGQVYDAIVSQDGEGMFVVEVRERHGEGDCQYIHHLDDLYSPQRARDIAEQLLADVTDNQGAKP